MALIVFSRPKRPLGRRIFFWSAGVLASGIASFYARRMFMRAHR